MTCPPHVHTDPKALLSLCVHCGEVVTYECRLLRDDELGVLTLPEFKELRRQWEERQSQKSAT